MRLISSILCLLVVLHCSYAPPVSPDKSKEDSEIKEDLAGYMEYHRYLKEVVQALESDPDFRERLEKADEDDVRSGKIAEQLDFVNHNVRTKLDEIKRRELDRLRHLATKQFELTNNLDTDTGKVPTNEHLDHDNPHTFEIEDLKKLIKQTTADLEEADKQRKEEFKEYEMQKQFDQHHKLETLDDTQKKEYMEKMQKEENAKKVHQPIHHPGSKQQLEEVWEKQDHMDQQFDPKAFFMMHDVDGNGNWDADEVKALFIKELDKLYSPDGPNKDLHERAEEMERMREHVFKENDKNRDGLIDYTEFMHSTGTTDFSVDEGWKPIDENQIYTKQEYDEFEKRRYNEFKYLEQRGLVDQHGNPVQGAEHQIHLAIQDYRAQIHNQNMQGHHYLPQQMHPPQMQGQYQAHHGQYQVPQGQFQQPPQGQFQQMPQEQQFHQGQQFQQVPQGQYQQAPQGQYQQAPQGQYQPVPQGQNFQQGPPGQQFQQVPQGQHQQPQQGQFQQAPPQQQGQFQQQPNVNQASAQVPVQNPAPQGQVQAQGQVQQQGQAAQAGQHPQGQVPPAPPQVPSHPDQAAKTSH